MDFIGFTINEQSYAVRIDEAVATIPTPIITHVPGTNPALVGMFSFHGELVPVVDLSRLYTGDDDQHPKYVIVVRGDVTYGILADRIDNVLRNEVPEDFLCLSIHDIENTVKQPPMEASAHVELF